MTTIRSALIFALLHGTVAAIVWVIGQCWEGLRHRGEVDTLDDVLRARIDGDPVDSAYADVQRVLLDFDDVGELESEIYAAQFRHRRGVDVFAGAPKEAF